MEIAALPFVSYISRTPMLSAIYTTTPLSSLAKSKHQQEIQPEINGEQTWDMRMRAQKIIRKYSQWKHKCNDTYHIFAISTPAGNRPPLSPNNVHCQSSKQLCIWLCILRITSSSTDIREFFYTDDYAKRVVSSASTHTLQDATSGSHYMNICTLKSSKHITVTLP